MTDEGRLEFDDPRTHLKPGGSKQERQPSTIVSPEEFQAEAEERTLWGDPPEKVLRFLLAQDVECGEALKMVDRAQQKRNAFIRSIGIRHVIIGVLLIAVPCATYAISCWLGAIPLKIFGATVLVGVIGFWKLIDGAWMILLPQKEKGEISSKYS
jgi:hypothetical protein